MLRERILDHFHERSRGISSLDFHLVQKLYHETGKALVRARDANGRVDFNKDIFGRADVNLELSRLVEGGVNKAEQFLVANIWPKFLRILLQLLLANIAMIVAI